MPVLLIVVVTVVGGRARLARGESVSRLPLPGSGRVSIGRVVAGFAIVAVLCLILNSAWAVAIGVMMGAAVLVLSMVVVTGYGGQLSLGQAALAGFGAWLAAHFLLWGVPFVLAVVLAMLVDDPGGPGGGPAGAGHGPGERPWPWPPWRWALIFSMVSTTARLLEASQALGHQNESVIGINVDPIVHPIAYAVLCRGGVCAGGSAVANLRRGRTGRRLLAVRGNERAASGIGCRGVSGPEFTPSGGLGRRRSGRGADASSQLPTSYRFPGVDLDHHGGVRRDRRYRLDRRRPARGGLRRAGSADLASATSGVDFNLKWLVLLAAGLATVLIIAYAA